MARILIVDDEESDRLFERTILEDEGHALFFAKDGEAALKAYTENAVDLVITDLHMPRLNGLRLIQELTALDPGVAVIAVSGVASDQLERAQVMGARRTLFKPLEPQVLLDTVREILRELKEGDPWGKRPR